MHSHEEYLCLNTNIPASTTPGHTGSQAVYRNQPPLAFAWLFTCCQRKRLHTGLDSPSARHPCSNRQVQVTKGLLLGYSPGSTTLRAYANAPRLSDSWRPTRQCPSSGLNCMRGRASRGVWKPIGAPATSRHRCSSDSGFQLAPEASDARTVRGIRNHYLPSLGISRCFSPAVLLANRRQKQAIRESKDNPSILVSLSVFHTPSTPPPDLLGASSTTALTIIAPYRSCRYRGSVKR